MASTSRSDATARRFDLALLVLALASVAWFVVGPHDAEYYEWLPRGVRAVVPGGVALVLVAVVLRVARRLAPGMLGIALRLGAITIVLTLAAMAGFRAALEWDAARSTDHWQPRIADNRATASDSLAFARLTPAERAAWAARVAQHRVLTDSAAWPAGGALTVPRSWAYPPAVTVARIADEARVRIWARAGSETACVASPAVSEANECGEVSPPSDATFSAVVRVLDPTPAPLAAPLASSVNATWLQYRRTSAHDAQVAEGAADSATQALDAWSHRIDGPIRSAASVVGDRVLIGTHGTGTIMAIDARTGASRWSSRVPNWIHMDIVSDGRVAAVGFGDNARSFTGRAPSGISVFDLATGALRWTRFDESSNMSGPLLRDSVLVYGTAVGVIRTRAIADGRLIAEDTLPGGVIMAPPSAHGDTVVFTLEHDLVCAVLAPTLRRLWCHQYPGYRMMGHAASAIANGQVVLSAVTTLGNLTWAEFRAAPFGLARRLVQTALFPVVSTEHGGQRLLALDLATGEERWRTTNFPKVRWVDGHTAGSASLGDTVGLVVLPEADVTVGFDPRNGHVRWTAPAHLARGPALLVGTIAIVTGMDGTLDVRNAVGGGVLCQAKRDVGFDRSGPAVRGRTMYFASRDGTVEAVPLADVMRCALPVGPKKPATSSSMGH